MPVPNLCFRAVCGTFYWKFQNFMQKRSVNIALARTNRLSFSWPVNFSRTLILLSVFILALCSQQCAVSDYGNESTMADCKFNNDGSSIQKCMMELNLSLLMLATMVHMKNRQMMQRAYFRIRFNTLAIIHSMLKGCISISVFVFLAWILLASGDIESNPGPAPGRRSQMDNMTSGYDYQYYSQQYASPLERLHTDLASTLNQAIDRMEKSNYQQGKNIETRIKSVEEKIDIRLQRLEDDQVKLSAETKKLRSQCQSLQHENEELRGSFTSLSNKCEFLENQHRRRNLLFAGLKTSDQGKESWEETEARIREVIKDGIGIEDFIHIEHIYRVGRAIIVQLLSYRQKIMILSQARRLKDSADFANVYINEDFSESVQRKRKNLIPLQRELKSRGQTAWLRFDKLMTEDTTFTYDLDEKTIYKQNRRKRYDRYEQSQYRARFQDVTQRIRNETEEPALRFRSEDGDSHKADGEQNGKGNMNVPMSDRQTTSQDIANSASDDHHSSEDEDMPRHQHTSYNLRSRSDCLPEETLYNTGQNSSQGYRDETSTSSSSKPKGKRQTMAHSQKRIDHMLRSSGSQSELEVRERAQTVCEPQSANNPEQRDIDRTV